MDHYTKFGVPNNFEELLPTLKTQTKKWETVCYSGTKINNSAKISFYLSPKNNPYGNIILSPGLATNTDIDPLMKTLTFWALTHRYNVICFDTFLGDFYPTPSFEVAQRNTYTEFTTLLEHCIKFTEQYFINQPNILIAHSAGATGTIDALNNIVSRDEKITIDSVLLFAPWVCEDWHREFKQIVYKRCQSNNYDNPHNILPITNVFDMLATNSARYVSIMPDFFEDMHRIPFAPDLMNKWEIYTTFVCGEKDKKSPVDQIKARYDELQKQPNKKLFKFVVMPNVKHSFLNFYENNKTVIDLIKSQRRKIRG